VAFWIWLHSLKPHVFEVHHVINTISTLSLFISQIPYRWVLSDSHIKDEETEAQRVLYPEGKENSRRPPSRERAWRGWVSTGTSVLGQALAWAARTD
jgi:hypothetical protein